MDTFAAIALSTEPPAETIQESKSFKNNAAVLSASVWRQILGISVWNVLIMTFKFIGMIAHSDYVAGTDVDEESPAGKH